MSVLESIARGLGMQAMGDPMPGPDVASGMSYDPAFSWNRGYVKLVGSGGLERSATFREIYLINPWVYAGVNYISRGIGRTPIHVYALDSEARKSRLRSDIPQTPGRPAGGVALDQLLRRPAGRVGRAAFFGSTLKNRLLYGNGLWELEGGGIPTALRHIPWPRVVDVETDESGSPKWYEITRSTPYTVGGSYGSSRTYKLYPEQVVHFGLGGDSDNACGVSFLHSCHATLALHEAIMRHLASYMGNSMRPSGSFFAENAKSAREARELITELYTSPENAGKVLVTNAKWQTMSDSPDHGQLVELIKESRIEICASLQMPPPVMGILENAIRANVKELREQFGRDTIGPWATETEDDIEAQLLPLVPSWSSLFTEFQLAEQLRPDLEARALVYQRLMWVMTIDEIRSMENLAPLDLKGVTNVPWVASGAQPVTTASRGKPGSMPPAGGAGAEDPSVHEIAAMLSRLDAIEAANGNGHLQLSEVT